MGGITEKAKKKKIRGMYVRYICIYKERERGGHSQSEIEYTQIRFVRIFHLRFLRTGSVSHTHGIE